MVRLTVSLRGSAVRCAGPGRGVSLPDSARDSIRAASAVGLDGSERHVHYLEEWTTEATCAARAVGVVHLGALDPRVRQEPPHVQFDFVTSTRGLDYLEESAAPTRGCEAQFR